MVLSIIGIYLFIMLFRMFYSLCLGFLYIKPSLVNKNKPLVSIIIPAWNEEIGIKKTIQSVMSSTYKNIEIIVVNDGSTDGTLYRVNKLVKAYRRNWSKIKIINQTNQGKANALNNGIRASQGGVIVTIDADSYLEKHALKRLVASLGNNKYDVAIGQIQVGNTKSLVESIQFFEYMFGFHLKRSQHVFSSIYIFPGALTAVRRSVIEDVGYFEDYSSTEDLDLSMKIKAKGHKVAYVEDAICITEGASSIQSLINQRTRWRHGFLQCVMHRSEFTMKMSKGLYLTLVDFPLSLLGILEILLYPVFLFIIYSQIVFSDNYIAVLVSYLILPYVFLLLSGGVIDNKHASLKYIILVPLLFSFVNIIEFIALIKAIYRTLTKRKTLWTSWKRQGI